MFVAPPLLGQNELSLGGRREASARGLPPESLLERRLADLPAAGQLLAGQRAVTGLAPLLDAIERYLERDDGVDVRGAGRS